MTGGGRGYCNPGGTGRFLGAGRWFRPRLGRRGYAAGGYGRGYGRFGYPAYGVGPADAYDDRIQAGSDQALLREQLAAIEEQLAEIRGRLSDSES